MNLRGLFASRSRIFCTLALACACAFAFHLATRPARAQKSGKLKTTESKKPTPSQTPASSSSAMNNDYAAKIKEYTTEKYFLTELVDHLPASDHVPSPDKVLGYVVGTPGKLTYTKDLYRYYRELERATPRVKVFTAPEKSEEGREQILVAVGDEAAIAKLDRYREITNRLSDPRKMTDAEAQQLILSDQT